MSGRADPQTPTPAAVARLAGLTPLDGPARAALNAAVRRPRRYLPRRELLSEGQEITETLLVLSGWAARVRTLEDGRRQIINFLLPGDLVGSCEHERPLALSTIIAVTQVDACVAPGAGVSPALARAYGLSRAYEEKHLLAHVTRLGRYDAREKIADFLLELLDRLELAGLAADGRYLMPITQEVMADALGLTSVHVNRMVQTLRRDEAVIWKGRELHIRNPAALARSIGRSAFHVTAG